MFLPRHPLFSALIGALVILQPALAFNFQWLNDAAISAFTDKDWELFSQTLENVLEKGKDNAMSQWDNQASGNSGSMEVRPVKTEGCRLVKIVNRSKTELGSSDLRFCKQRDGSWKIDNKPAPEDKNP